MRATNRARLSTFYRYDLRGRAIETWGAYAETNPSLADDLPLSLADGRTRGKGIFHRKIDYHERGCREVTDSTETRRYQAGVRGKLEKCVTGGAVTSYRYDDHGFEVERMDPMGATWHWVRDDRGRVLEIVDPLGRRTKVKVVNDPAAMNVIETRTRNVFNTGQP